VASSGEVGLNKRAPLFIYWQNYLDDEELTEASEVLYIPWTDWVVIVEEEQR